MLPRECVSCGEDRALCCRGLCGRCRSQARRDGAVAEFGYVKADRLADFAALRRSCSVPVASSRLGVCERTGWRYEAERRVSAPAVPAQGTEGVTAERSAA